MGCNVCKSAAVLVKSLCQGVGGPHQLNDWSVKTGMDLMGISDIAALRLHYEAAAH